MLGVLQTHPKPESSGARRLRNPVSSQDEASGHVGQQKAPRLQPPFHRVGGPASLTNMPGEARSDRMYSAGARGPSYLGTQF